MKRWVGLTPGQIWHLDTGEILKLVDFAEGGELIFEHEHPESAQRLIMADYLVLDNYIDERGGALRV